MRSDPNNAAHPDTSSEDGAALTNGGRLQRQPVRVFLCYRRKDALCSALRLYDWLERCVGRDNVFIDFASIGGGQVFPEVIEQKVTTSDVVLAVVGPNWLTAARSGQEDFVALEIATALRNRVPVIPVFVDDATMPDPAVFPKQPEEFRGFALLNGLTVSHSHWRADFERLDKEIAAVCDQRKRGANASALQDALGTLRRWAQRGELGQDLVAAADSVLSSETSSAERRHLLLVLTHPDATADDLEFCLRPSLHPRSIDRVPPLSAQPVRPRIPQATVHILRPAGEVHYQDATEELGPWVRTRGEHTLWLPPEYRVAAHLVTNDLYSDFVRAGGYARLEYWLDAPPTAAPEHFLSRDRRSPGPETWESADTPPPGLEDHPVTGISFYEALAFVRWLQDADPPGEGWRWTLPTEDMWEFAARGVDGRAYPWGTDWKSGMCNSRESDVGGTTPVGRFPDGRSPDGCFDMAGNAWEFVHSRDMGSLWCALRGGSFRNNRHEVRTSLRLFGVRRDHRPLDFGIRCAQVQGEPE